MTTVNRKGPIIDPGLCRCCGVLKKCRLLNHEYVWMGQKEIYSEMFVDCFGLLLSHLDGEAEERLVCATCVVRLRDASSFRQQVLQCEEKFLQSKIQICNEETLDTEIKLESDFRETQANGGEPLIDEVDYVDHTDSIDNDIFPESIIKNEVSSRVKKKTVKKEKKEKNNKGVKKKDKSKKKLAVVKKHEEEDEMFIKMKRLEEKLKRMENCEPKSRVIDEDYKGFLNTVTIVESSFVCPFDTSFSDYFCVYCRQVFTDPCKLREHTSTHDPQTFKDAVANKKLILVDIVRIDCRFCSEKIHNIESLKTHITTYHEKVIYDVSNEFLKFRLTLNNLSCIECNSSFGFFHALKKHMAEHFGTCICDICGAHYFEERMLILHQKSHQKKVEENYPCKECGKNFKSKHSRYLHVSKMHTKEPAYQCSKCDEVLFSYTLRYRHMIEVHGEERMFPCEHCDRAYDSRKSLREHNRRNHLKIFKHQCDLCEKRFYLPSRLKEHMVIHTGERNFRCEYCGKSYPRLRGLKVHMQSHSSEKKFKCMLCNTSFTQNVNLKNHMKRQHQSLGLVNGYQE